MHQCVVFAIPTVEKSSRKDKQMEMKAFTIQTYVFFVKKDTPYFLFNQIPKWKSFACSFYNIECRTLIEE